MADQTADILDEVTQPYLLVARLQARVAEAEAELARLYGSIWCAFCGETYALGVANVGDSAREHARQCEGHPLHRAMRDLAAATAREAVLREALAGVLDLAQHRVNHFRMLGVSWERDQVKVDTVRAALATPSPTADALVELAKAVGGLCRLLNSNPLLSHSDTDVFESVHAIVLAGEALEQARKEGQGD